MKTFYYVLSILLLVSQISLATVTVTAASGGTNLTPTSPNVSGGWATLGNIVITEGLNSDFSTGTNVTLVLSAPTNWRFDATSGSVISSGSFPSSSNISARSIGVTSSAITITVTVSGTNKGDALTISGIKVQPINSGIVPSLGNILRSGGTATMNGITGSTNFGTLSLDENNPMPVELSSFTASVSKEGVLLKWITQTEVKNLGFAVERKTKTDWEQIGFVAGAGNSNSVKNYSYIDKNAFGIVSYRLKQVDTDGKFEYSKAVEVKAALASTYALSNYPNPFNPATTIRYELPEATHVKLAVFNVIGEQVVLLTDADLQQGVYEQSFNGKNLTSGTYIYMLQAGSQVISKKMALIK